MVSRIGFAAPHFQARYQIKEPRNLALGAADSTAGSGVAALGAINYLVAEANLPANEFWGPVSMGLGAVTAVRGASIATQAIEKASSDDTKKATEPK